MRAGFAKEALQAARAEAKSLAQIDQDIGKAENTSDKTGLRRQPKQQFLQTKKTE